MAPGPFTGGAGYAGVSGVEVPPGITAHALLAAVAMRRGQPQGPQNDQEIEEFVYDALELLPGTNDVEVRSDNGRVTLTGSVQQKRLKRDVGEIVWAIPSITDLMNNVTIATRRRGRAGGREAETPQPAGRKHG
jgi:osmotically-inducible protein OsmY